MGLCLMERWKVMPTKMHSPYTGATEALAIQWCPLSRTILKPCKNDGYWSESHHCFWPSLSQQQIVPQSFPLTWRSSSHIRKHGCLKQERGYAMSSLVLHCETWTVLMRGWLTSPSCFSSWGQVPFCLVFLYHGIPWLVRVQHVRQKCLRL